MRSTNDLYDVAALQAFRSNEVVVIRNHFDTYHHNIYLSPDSLSKREHEGWYIVNNLIQGDDHSITTTYSLSGEGVDLQISNHHTVAFNTIERVADGISFPGRNVDVFGNRILDANDEFMEFDLGQANVRFWGNECVNAAQHSFSFQPQLAGPWYVVRNRVINPEIVPEGGNYAGPSYAFKYAGPVDRHVLWQNTLVSAGTWSGYGANPLFKAITRNNVIAFTQGLLQSNSDKRHPFSYKTSWETFSNGKLYRPDAAHYESRRSWTHDVDYSGFYWPAGQEFARYGSDTYEDFHQLGQARFSSSFERHSVRLSDSDFRNPEGDDWGPAPQSAVIDAGVWIPGINDDYVGAAPDLGVEEVGGWTPLYGNQESMTLQELHLIWSFNG